MENFYVEPPKDLLKKIMTRIHKEERVLALRKIIIFSVTFMASIIGLVPSFKMLVTNFNSSGFLNFFSLLFSDFPSVATYWQSFTMILLETIPAISLALFLAVLLTLMQSAVSLTKNAKVIINTNRLATN